MNKLLREKILRNEWLTPFEMVDLMKFYRARMAEGDTVEQIGKDLGIDPAKSLIVE